VVFNGRNNVLCLKTFELSQPYFSGTVFAVILLLLLWIGQLTPVCLAQGQNLFSGLTSNTINYQNTDFLFDDVRLPCNNLLVGREICVLISLF
jgi:hypothetical protein